MDDHHSMESTAPPVSTQPVLALPQSIRSDELPKLASVLRSFSHGIGPTELFRMDVILDANIVFQELIWLSRTRRNPKARSNISEVMDCATVRAYAPTFLLQEIDVNIPKVASLYRLKEVVLRDHWSKFMLSIHFMDVGGPSTDSNLRDPKDAPYLRLQKLLDAPIATNDADVAAMGGRVVQVQLFATLKCYSRSKAVEFHLKMTGVGSIIAVILLATGIFRFAQSTSGKWQTIPKPVLYLGLALVTAAILYPTSRKKILEVLQNLFAGTATIAEHLITSLQPFFLQHSNARESADSSLASAKQLGA